MVAFIPEATYSLYVPFDTAFVYLGYLPDFYFYFLPEIDDKSSDNANFFSIGRLYFPFHRPFGVGVRKPRLIDNSGSFYKTHMGREYLLREVKCLNLKHYVCCCFSSQFPISQSEIEKVLILERLCDQVDNYYSKDSLQEDFSFGNFLIGSTFKSWGKYMCLTYEDQKSILGYILNSSRHQRTGFSMVSIEDFYKSSVEPSFSDLQRDSLWSARLSLDAYFSLGKIYRSRDWRCLI